MRLRAALVGPTASGKSRLAHRLARELGDLEIVSLDSMSVYRGLDTATAKPTHQEREEVTYHLIDVVGPSEEFSVADALAHVRALSLPRKLLGVGGTGLYARAIIDDLEIPGVHPEIRHALEQESDLEALYRELVQRDPLGASRMDPTNGRRVRRALEVCRATGRPFSSFGPGLDSYPASSVVQVGLQVDFADLDSAIEKRLRTWVETGLLDEVRRLDAEGLSRAARQAVGYKEFFPAVHGDKTVGECLEEAIANTRRLARRQWRWFRRDPRVTWYRDLNGAYDHLMRALASAPDVGD